MKGEKARPISPIYMNRRRNLCVRVYVRVCVRVEMRTSNSGKVCMYVR